MMRYIGIVLVFVSLVYAGRYKAYTYRQRQKQLYSFAELTGYITSRIEFYNERLDEIYADCPDCGIGGFITQLRNGKDFTSALEGMELYINADEKNVLSEFGSGLGKSLREEQLRLCAYTSERLKSSCDKCTAELPKQVKLAETLSLLAAFMAVILLI